MASIVQGNAAAPGGSGTADTQVGIAFAGATTAGNLLVMWVGGRDDGSNGVPVITWPSGWTEVGVTAPMEFHTFGMAWKVADGSETTAQTATFDRLCHSRWVGMVEFNEPGVSDWAVDASSFNGSGASNTPSIASGSTGVLSASSGVVTVGGTSRTNDEDLSTDVGTSLAGTDAQFEVDAGSANFIAAWLDLASTAALDATITEGDGSSRMGAGIGVFVEDGAGGGVEVVPSVAELAFDALAPSVSGSANVEATPPAAEFTFVAAAPAASAAALVQPPSAELTLAGVGTITTTDVDLGPPPTEFTLVAPAPTVTAGGAVTVSPPVAELTLAGLDPTVAADATATAPAAEFTLEALSPLVTAGNVTVIQPPVAELSLAGLAPAVASDVTVLAPTGEFTLTGVGPLVTTIKPTVPPGHLVVAPRHGRSVTAPRATRIVGG